MKESKQVCPKLPPPPKPNLKNKNFVKWSRGESCKKEDNIISTDWHEKLQRTAPFVPAYDNAPLNMVYLLSGEYGRIWKKERDEWYSNVFVLREKEKDMDDRKKKIRKEIREAKKAAENNIRERKERKAKEAELKAKAEAEKFEKLKAKKGPVKSPKNITKKKETKDLPPPTTETKPSICPKGWIPVELTIQCECSDHKKEATNLEKKEENELQETQSTKPEPNPQICPKYFEQIKDMQKVKTIENFEEPKINTEVKNMKQLSGKEISTEEQ